MNGGARRRCALLPSAARQRPRRRPCSTSSSGDPAAEPVTDPIRALQLLAGKLQRAAGVLGARVASTELDGVTALAWTRVLRGFRQTLEGMQRPGLAERHVELEADRVRLMALALGRVFDVLGLNAGQRQVGTRVLLEELRAAAAVPPGEDG
jgi:hypothetical protein